MADNQDSSLQSGTGATPTDASSSSAGVQPSSEQVTITKAEFDQLKNTLSQLESAVRSEKDRSIVKANQRLDKLESDVQPLLARAAELMKEGKSPQEAITEANSEYEDDEAFETLRDFAKFWKDGGKQLLGGLSGRQAANSVNVTEVFGKILGQESLKSPIVAPLLAKQYNSEAEAEADALRVFHQLSTLPNPTQAQSAAMTGGTGGTGSVQDKINQLARLQENPFENMKEIRKLTAELDAANWGGLT